MKTLSKTFCPLVTALVLATGCSKDDGGNGTTENRPPEAFDLIAVADGATDVDVKPTFSWNPATDPDGDEVTYNLYLGTDAAALTEVATGLTAPSFQLEERLSLLTGHFWKVLAEDGQGGLTESETFVFETRNLNDAQQRVDFAALAFTGAMVFDGKLWVVGGSNSNGFNNDVWYSEDGANWSLATTNAAFPERNAHTTLAYDGKLWVIGGYNNNGSLDDVWSSSDGIVWTEVVNSNFPERHGHTSVVFDDKMWLIGGYDDTHDYDDVWYSDDGYTWSMAANSAGFESRKNHSSVVFDNKIWVIGGGHSGVDFLNDVWYSSDGIEWILSNSNTDFSKRGGHSTVVFNGKLWLIGGETTNGVVNDVWSSKDGATWTEVFSNAAFPPRRGHASAVFDEKIWVIGGYNNNAIFYSGAWFMD